MERTARDLQRTVTQFMKLSNWTVVEDDIHTLKAQKRLGGNEWTWTFHFEDERSISQAGSAALFAKALSDKADRTMFFDLILTQAVSESRRWRDDLGPEVEKAFSRVPNRRSGRAIDFLNRFAREVSDASATKVQELLQGHFVKAPVRPFFKSGEDALDVCGKWVAQVGSPRIMLVTGDAGAGKSVFGLMVVTELKDRFLSDASNPAPFLIWFSKDRPALVDDLIALALTDLGLQQSLTPSSIRFLLEQGRLALILDGFDEVSRALAQNAEDNVEELSKNINKRTLGKLMLTARPSFVAQEDIFSTLKSSCDEDSPAEYEIAPYTDEQMREWVTRNPPDGALSPPARHWQRVDTAFRQGPPIKELCRTPVFLRMMSEVLVSRPSVASLYELLEQFCVSMWERERKKRPLALSDEQYFYAYEGISIAIDSESRIEAGEIKTALDLYFQEYCPQLLAGLPGAVKTLVEDLSIGPLTFKGGIFEFVHDVLAAYFLSRMMARRLLSGRQIAEPWNRPLKDTVWRFLPDALLQISGGRLDAEKIVNDFAVPSKSGLVAWNIVRALNLPRDRFPRDLFRRKQLAGIIFDQDLRGVSFDGSELFDVTFDRCDLEGATFGSATIHKVKFVECGRGAVIDGSLVIQESSEVLIIRDPARDTELYTGDSVRAALEELFEERRQPIQVPQDLTERAVVLIFSSLFKIDLRRLDYPEWSKVENRIRGWVRSFGLSSHAAREIGRVLLEMANELLEEGWLSRNPNRPRTFVPAPDRQRIVSDVIRLGRVRGTSAGLEAIALKYADRVRGLLR